MLLILSDSRGAIKDGLLIEFHCPGAAGTVAASKPCSLRDDCELPLPDGLEVRLNSKDLRVQEHFVSTIESGKVRGGMGALPHESGVAFRVWAPHADAVYVSGSFNDWSSDAHPMAKEGDGYWYADIAAAAIGNEYRYRIVSGDKQLLRIDPYAREVTSSVGNAVVHDPHFDWGDDDFHLPAINELVIYEMHLGTFHDKEDGKSDKFAEAVQKLDHLQRLGVNVIEVMPLAQFAGDVVVGIQPILRFRRGNQLRRCNRLQAVCQVGASGRLGGDPGRRLQPLRSDRPRSLAV